jgi:molybdopterin-guanine dinucleotide biosynthesis protein B
MTKRIACFIGWSNTGKTGFVEACAKSLSRKGVAVGAVKCVRHEGSFNLPGKDSTRFFEAGAEAALVSDDETVIVKRTPSSWNRQYAESLFPEAAVVLVEGRIVDGAVKVLVGGPAADEAGLKRSLDGFDVLITEHPVLAERAIAAGLAVFDPESSDSFIDLYLTGDTMEDRKLTVTTGGVELPLNPFVNETIANVVLALLKPLKKTNLDGEIVITLGKANK